MLTSEITKTVFFSEYEKKCVVPVSTTWMYRNRGRFVDDKYFFIIHQYFNWIGCYRQLVPTKNEKANTQEYSDDMYITWNCSLYLILCNHSRSNINIKQAMSALPYAIALPPDTQSIPPKATRNIYNTKYFVSITLLILVRN